MELEVRHLAPGFDGSGVNAGKRYYPMFQVLVPGDGV